MSQRGGRRGLEGVLAHQNSRGHAHVLQSGQVPLMSAGRGVTHREFNPSPDLLTHFLQIWILPQPVEAILFDLQSTHRRARYAAHTPAYS